MSPSILVIRLPPPALVENRSGLEWPSSRTLPGRWDRLGVIRATDLEASTRGALLPRSDGQARTKVWPVMLWAGFKAMTIAQAGMA
jgi:hypothetical protein